MQLTITEKAAKKIEQIAIKENKIGSVFHIQVLGGGCSGLAYQFGFSEEVLPKDKLFEQFGVKVAVDSRSWIYIAGSELDYEEGLMKSGFKINNPNVVASCSCGESFSV